MDTKSGMIFLIFLIISIYFIGYKFGGKNAAEKEFMRINAILQDNYGIILDDRTLKRVGIIEDKLNTKKGGTYGTDIR
jgi:hypothetical protein